MSKTIDAMKQALAAGEKFIAKVHTGRAKSTETYDDLTASNRALREAITQEEAQAAEPAQITCQIYGHVVGACGECNTHSDEDVNATNAILATRYFELLKTMEEAQTVEPNAEFNAAINFAISQGWESAEFLRAWRAGDTSEWHEFTHPAPAKPSAGEREALVQELRELIDLHVYARDLTDRAADMLAADALEIADLSDRCWDVTKYPTAAQQVAVPQGWISRPTYPNENDKWQYSEVKPQSKRNSVEFDVVEVFAAPQPPQAAPRVPMTRDQVDDLAEDGCFLGNVYEITQAVEQFHKIGVKL